MQQIVLFPKQEEYFDLNNKINVFSGGIQSSKTTTGALRMTYKGILAYRDPKDNFLIAADTYKTLSQATIPTFLRFAKPYGKMNWGKAEFECYWGSHVYFRTGTHPDSAEGIPNVRRCWLDEGGKVTRYFWENIEGRAARLEAPVDITTTPYAMNWLATMCKAAQEGTRSDVSLVHCKSIESPYFSMAEYERQKRLLDPRRFAMKYDGEFGQMEGLVYDIYQKALIKSCELPSGTEYYAGIDWGYYPDPFCLVLRALTPQKVHFRVAEYYRHHLTISDILNVVKSYHGLYRFKRIFCDPSQPASIEELVRAKLPAVGADNELRAGIDKHYALIKSERFYIFEDQNANGVDEYAQYHYREERELGFNDDLKEKDKLPVDQDNHGIDADRYVTVGLESGFIEKTAPKNPEEESQRPIDLATKLRRLQRGGRARGGAYDY